MHDHTLLSAVVAGVLEVAVRLGHDRDALMAAAGLDAAMLADPDARLPVEHDLRLWQALSRAPVGLDVGERLGTASMGVVGYALQHGATVGDALAWLERYRAVLHPDLVPRLERRAGPEGERAVFVKVVPPPFARLHEPVYAQAAATVAVMRALTGRDVRARSVAYPMPRPRDPERHERWFGCPVSWGGPTLEVAFDAAVLALPLPRAEPALFGYLARRVEALHGALPASAGWTDRARREIGALLPQGEPRLGDVARRLAVSERTLHRRLAEEGARFAALVEEARRERATLLLDDARMGSSEIAFLLGYAEPAAFFRAFRRWTGVTPQRWRGERREHRERTRPGAPAGAPAGA
jgi:AraC-like DNA-binding protein